MLFCDVTGSTAAAEQLDPEEWAEIMNGAFDHMIRPVYRFEGTVARLMGDAVLAFFGAPLAYEDDPQRAVLAGLEIIEEIEAYREEVRSEWGFDFQVRVGINTGLVMVGQIGSDLQMEYTAMGDAVNLAARMEQTAEPGTVQIAENTYKQVAPFFDLEELGGITVKGKKEPVKSYRVLSRTATPGRLRGIEGLEAPLIGREHEKALLKKAMADLENGRGGIVCLIGEAGLGKSRLIGEIERRDRDGDGDRDREESREPSAASPHSKFTIANSQLTISSLSYESGHPYALFQRLVRRLIGAAQGDPPEMLREKIAGYIASLLPDTGSAAASEDREEVVRVFESLFGLESALGKPPLEGEAFKGRLFVEMSALWQGLAAEGPVVLVCDDLHWTDPASAALLLHLLSLTEKSPLLIVCAMRPESSVPGWQVRQVAEADFGHRYLEIRLQPLTADEGGELVDSLLRVSDLPPRLRARIQEKTEGNPFFVEEVVRTLIDSGTVVRGEGQSRWTAVGEGDDVDIPGNVQALLIARIDRLEEGARRTLQLASVAGRNFYYRVLARIVEAAGALGDQLLTLQEAALIREAARYPELEYIFRHALTQEAAYSTMLLKQRRAYHRRTAEAIESLFPDKVEELSGTLAHHFHEARDYERAVTYYTLAGDAAYRLHASAEAVQHYTLALEAAKMGKVDLGSETRVHLYSRKGRSLELSSRFDDALDNYREMATLAADSGDRALELASLTAQCILRATQTPLYDPAAAAKLASAAMALAKELGDRASQARVLWGLLLVEVWGGGDDEKGLDYGRRSLAIARELGLREQEGFTQTNLVNAYWAIDRLGDALAANLAAREIWLELGNTPMLADSYSMTIWAHWLAGDFEAALAAGHEDIRVSRSIGNVWNHRSALTSMAQVYLDLGDYGGIFRCHRETIQINESAGLPTPSYDWVMVRAYVAAGALDGGERAAEYIYSRRDTTLIMFLPYVMAAYAVAQLALGKPTEARRSLDQLYEAMGSDMDGHSSLGIAPPLLADAQLQLALGKPERALEILDYLIERLRRAELRLYLPEALWLQGNALLALDRPEQAYEILEDARRVAEQNGERRIRWQILAALAEAEEEQRNEEAARSLWAEARKVVNYVANHAGDELRPSFLAISQVSKILAKSDANVC
jgi:class 3 adenylate cyclase/tetratricopeptide (TPR) repeat protein